MHYLKSVVFVVCLFFKFDVASTNTATGDGVNGVSDPVCTSFPSDLIASQWVGETNMVTFTFETNTAGDVTFTDPDRLMLNDFTCVSNTDNVFIFRSQAVPMAISGGRDGWFYQCMRINKVTDNLFYFYLLTDPSSFTPSISPNLASTSSTCEICTAVGTSQVFFLRRSGTYEPFPTAVPVCSPCTKTQAECDTSPVTQAGNSLVTSPSTPIVAEQSVPDSVVPIATNSQVSGQGVSGVQGVSVTFVDAILVLLAIVGIEAIVNVFSSVEPDFELV